MRGNTRGFIVVVVLATLGLVAAACTPPPPTNVAPTAVAGATPTTGTAPLAVVFDSSGSTDTDGTIASVAWDFGDGATSTAANPSHTYTTAATYTATLTVTDDEGATGTDTVTIAVTEEPNVAPTAVANATPSSGRFPLDVDLSSAGSSDTDGTIVAFSWNFGDGTGNSSDPNPTHTYANPGTFTATLTVTDDDGATGEATVVVVVTPNVAPSAAAVGVPTSGQFPLTVAFSSAGSNDTDGTIDSYDWDFGDGGSSTAVNPSYTYTQPGSYTATLTVTDNDGATDDATVGISATAADPTASFTKSVSSGIAPQPVSFNGSASSDSNPGGSIASYAWNFGDGSTGTGATPSHTYTSTGTFTVQLTVTSNYGGVDTTTQTVTIGAFLPPQNFDLYDAEGEFFDDGRFYFNWTNIDSGSGFSHTYQVNVESVAGCIAFGSKTRTVNPSGAVGTGQNYVWVQSWPASNVCLGSQYRARARSVRSDGAVSAWTAWDNITISHT
jgi:PKD repeat protein